MFSFYGKSFHGAHFAEPTVFLNNLFPEVDPCPILLKLELICTFTEYYLYQKQCKDPLVLQLF